MVNITPASSGIIQDARDEKDSLKKIAAPDSRIAQSGKKVLNLVMYLKMAIQSSVLSEGIERVSITEWIAAGKFSFRSKDRLGQQ